MINLTTSAIEQLSNLLAKNSNVLGLRIDLKEAGCSGQTYVFEFAKTQNSEDTIQKTNNVTIFLSTEAAKVLNGATLDYVVNDLSATFKITNPNETGNCGCGESVKF